MRKFFFLFVSCFLFGHVATAQYHNTTINYVPDTDCDTQISGAGGNFGFEIDISHTNGGWQGSNGTAWLSNVDMMYTLEFTNTATGQVEHTYTFPTQNLPNSGTTLLIDHNLLYFEGFEDGEYSVRLFVKAERSASSSLGVDFKIEDLVSGQLSQSTLQSNGSYIEFSTGVIFCFEYEKCDDADVSIVQTNTGYYADIQELTPDPSQVFLTSITWVITENSGNKYFIHDVMQIAEPIDCSDIELIVTDLATGCKYRDSRPCPIDLCNLSPPTNFGVQDLGNGYSVVYWSPVAGAAGYKIQVTYNDANCCKDSGPEQAPEIFYSNTNSITFSNAQKYSCFSIRVVAECANGGFGQVSEESCHELPSPFKMNSSVNGADFSSDKESLFVYPNPASDQVQIELTGEKGELSQLTILDSKGTVVLKRDVQINSIGNTIVWDLQDVQSGVYIVRLTSSSGVLMRRLSVTK